MDLTKIDPKREARAAVRDLLEKPFLLADLAESLTRLTGLR